MRLWEEVWIGLGLYPSCPRSMSQLGHKRTPASLATTSAFRSKAEVFPYELLRLRLARGDARSAVIGALCNVGNQRCGEPRSTRRPALNMLCFAEMSLKGLAHRDCQSRNNHKSQGGSHETPSASRP